MPATFPSHVGFVAPLWRRWPDRFDVAALSVGSVMPDVVDLIIGIARGHLAQNLGHSLFGVVVIGTPLGLVLRELVCATARRLTPLKRGGFPAYAWNLGVAALARAVPFRGRWKLLATSVAVGAFTHLLVDLISHGHFPWLLPFAPRLPIFPEWWNATWLRVWLPWHPAGRKVGPHAVMWIVLTFWGAWLLLRPAYQAWRKECARKYRKPSPSA